MLVLCDGNTAALEHLLKQAEASCHLHLANVVMRHASSPHADQKKSLDWLACVFSCGQARLKNLVQDDESLPRQAVASASSQSSKKLMSDSRGEESKDVGTDKIRLESLQSVEAGDGGGGWKVDGEELGERLIKLQRLQKKQKAKSLEVGRGHIP